jgi:hypothetical protein
MASLHLTSTRNTPDVILDPLSNKYRIEGISTPINAFEFYETIMNWITANQEDIEKNARFVFHMPYFNSASMKALMLLIQHIRDLGIADKQWQIEWVVEDEDEFMLDAANSIQDLLNMQFIITEI